jgi:Plant ATP synthase F0
MVQNLIFKKIMPQIDKVTFLTTVYWTFVFYFVLYLDLSVTYLYKFFTALKFKTQRMCWVYRNVQISTLRARLLSSGAWF